jgi:hypothetical protein
MPTEHDETWFGGRRWTGIAAIGVVAVIGLCAALLVLGHLHHKHVDSAAAAPSTPQPTAAPPHTSASSAQPARSVPSTAPPAGVSWALLNGYALPGSPADGPARVAGSVAAGFSHTPTGALLAVVNAQLRLTATTPAACAAEARSAFEHTPAAAAIADQCLHPSGPPERYQLAGYAYLSYSPALATITYAIRDEATAKLVEVTGTVVWSGSDWLVSLPGAAAGGNPIGPTAVIDSLSGLVAWAGA